MVFLKDTSSAGHELWMEHMLRGRVPDSGRMLTSSLKTSHRAVDE